jgi:hypothetical protein
MSAVVAAAGQAEGSITTEEVSPSSKIALMFLVRETLNQPSAWEAFLRNHEGKYEVYCHPKEKDKVQIPMLMKGVIDENVATGWGDVSVTKAIIALLRAAVKDPNNKKFCLFSESCVPLERSFDTVRTSVLSHNKSYFDFMNLSDYRRRYEQLQQPRSKPHGYNNGGKGGKGGKQVWIPEIHFKKHATWFIMDRRHVEVILRVQKRYINLFNKVTVPDEHFFATVLCCEGYVSDLLPKQTTFVDWEANNFWYLKKQRFFMKWGLRLEKAGERLPQKMTGSQLTGKLPKKALKEWNEIQQLDAKMWSDDLIAHPRTFSSVSQEDIQRMRSSLALFARKFSLDSNYTTIYWMDILASTPQPSLPGRVVINPFTGRYDVPQYLQSQWFYEMQGMIAYTDSSLRELKDRHGREKNKLEAMNQKKVDAAVSQERDALLQGFENDLGLVGNDANGNASAGGEDSEEEVLLMPGQLLGLDNAGSSGDEGEGASGANTHEDAYQDDYGDFSDDDDDDVVMNFDLLSVPFEQ